MSNAVRKRGRRSKLTPEVIEKARQYIRAGNFAEDAATLCGISASTYFSWRAQAEELAAELDALGEGEEITVTAHQELLLDFLEATTHADAEVKTTALMAWRRFFPSEREVTERRVAKDGTVTERTYLKLEGDYRAAKDFLERRFRDQFSPRAEVTGSGGGPVQFQGETRLIIDVVPARPAPAGDTAPALPPEAETDGS